MFTETVSYFFDTQHGRVAFLLLQLLPFQPHPRDIKYVYRIKENRNVFYLSMKIIAASEYSAIQLDTIGVRNRLIKYKSFQKKLFE